MQRGSLASQALRKRADLLICSGATSGRALQPRSIFAPPTMSGAPPPGDVTYLEKDGSQGARHRLTQRVQKCTDRAELGSWCCPSRSCCRALARDTHWQSLLQRRRHLQLKQTGHAAARRKLHRSASTAGRKAPRIYAAPSAHAPLACSQQPLPWTAQLQLVQIRQLRRHQLQPLQLMDLKWISAARNPP